MRLIKLTGIPHPDYNGGKPQPVYVNADLIAYVEKSTAFPPNLVKREQMQETMKLVLIEWLDSHSGRGWQSPENLKRAAEPLYCQSVGWLLAENKECKVIVPHIGGQRGGDEMMQGCGDLTIPASAIVKMTTLRR